MNDRRFVYTRKDGTPSKPVGLTETMKVAVGRIVPGTGPFAVNRGDYAHPNLSRTQALRVLRGILSERLDAGESVRIRDADGVILTVFRTEPESVYRNPFRDAVGLFPLRIDQGVDYGVRRDSPVYAIGPGIVRTYRTDTGWPWGAGKSPPDDHGAYIAYELTEGPARGKLIYDAERITLNAGLKVGDRIDSDTRIAIHHPTFANCEMGWAAGPSGYSPLAVSYYREGARTAAGDNFSKFMQSLGAPAGLVQGRSLSGQLPGGWPKDWQHAR